MILPLLAIGQDYMVESFDIVPNDLAARTKVRVDNKEGSVGLSRCMLRMPSLQPTAL